MTEDEAVTKWCPMARVSDLTTTYNRDANPDSKHQFSGWKCVASDCMMWRTSCRRYLDKGKLFDRDETGTGVWVEIGGYCGLGGKP